MTYIIPLSGGTGGVTVEAALMYQPIAFRWADNLRQYDGLEPKRFVQYYDSMSAGSAQVLAGASIARR